MPSTRRYEQRARAARAAETRDRVIAAARELIPLAERSLPVADISRHAGVAVQTIYDQFGSKGGLLIAVVNDLQEREGLFKSFGSVFTAPHGEEAMRRMLAATVRFWDRAWPYIEFLLRSRRIDPVVGTEMDFVDRLRHAHYWAISQRLADERRLRAGHDATWAADQAFALSTPTVYEEIAARRGGTLQTAIETTTTAVLGVILEPGTEPMTTPPPDWAALERAAADRAISHGADPARLNPAWASTRPGAPATGRAARRPGRDVEERPRRAARRS
jgi:AcrR family transcriptional regulator